MNIVFKSGDYVSVPMTENLFWNRVGNLRNAMLTAENFEFRLLYFHKLQELMRFVPWVLNFHGLKKLLKLIIHRSWKIAQEWAWAFF